MNNQNLNIQTYSPLRLKVLKREELRLLSEKKFYITFTDILLNYLQIALALILVHISEQKLIFSIFGIFIVGISQYSLMVIGHDGLHRNFIKNIKKNDILNDILILGMFGSACRVNRNNHSEHHKFSSTDHDPDRYKYLHQNKETLIKYFIFLSGFSNFLKTIKNVYLNKEVKIKENNQNLKLNNREIIVILSWQLFLFASLTYYFGLFGYFFYWFLPLYIFAYRADLSRVFCEHNEINNNETENDENYRLITYPNPNALEKLLFCPNNMNFHAEHHLFPQIPYYNLKLAHNLVKNNGGYTDKLHLRKSYFGYIFGYIKKINAKD